MTEIREGNTARKTQASDPVPLHTFKFSSHYAVQTLVIDKQIKISVYDIPLCLYTQTHTKLQLATHLPFPFDGYHMSTSN